MGTDSEKWAGWLGERFFKEIGVRRGHTVLDFGCGTGAYVLPAASAVGAQGRVYAVDKSEISLSQLRARVQSQGVRNVEIISSAGELTLPLGSNSLDVILLYDVIHSYYFSDYARCELLREIYRVCKLGGLLSVYPYHLDWRQAHRQVESAGFRFQARLYQTLLHNRALIHDHVLNFRKSNPGSRRRKGTGPLQR